MKLSYPSHGVGSAYGNQEEFNTSEALAAVTIAVHPGNWKCTRGGTSFRSCSTLGEQATWRRPEDRGAGSTGFEEAGA